MPSAVFFSPHVCFNTINYRTNNNTATKHLKVLFSSFVRSIVGWHDGSGHDIHMYCICNHRSSEYCASFSRKFWRASRIVHHDNSYNNIHIIIVGARNYVCVVRSMCEEVGASGGLYGVDDAFMHFRFENENNSQERDTKHTLTYTTPHYIRYMVQLMYIS